MSKLTTVCLQLEAHSSRLVAFLKLILPHHAFYGAVGLSAVLGIFFLIVFYFNLTFYRKINQLSHRHTAVYFHRLLYRYFQSPVAAETDIPLSGSGVYVDTESACR